MAEALQILHQDLDLLVLDKPAGLLVHPSGLDAHETDTVLARAQAQFGGWLGPAHRLDKGTSGVLLLARNPASAAQLAVWFREGQVRKHYLGLVRGWPAADSGRIDHPLARDPELPSQGQPLLEAQTDWQCLQRHEWPVQTQAPFPGTRTSLLAFEPLQGRRHQIRRHCKHFAHPLIGDATHGKGPLNRVLAAHWGLTRLWLHALWLELPDGRRFEAAPGPDWQHLA